MSFRSIGLLALLVLALTPAPARAETSSEKVYVLPSREIESVPEEAAAHHAHPKPHGSATTDTGEELAETATAPEEPEAKHRHPSGPPPPSEGGNHPPGRGPGRKSGVSISVKKVGLTPAQANIAASGGGGGCSPVLPILIAVAVLAAISIGIVLYRERRQGETLEP
jgi:hypothetical protein